MITHKEAKESHARLFDSYLDGCFVPFPTRSDLDTIEVYITQQEQFAKDVARYFYLEKLPDDKYTVEVGIEHHALREKLSKGD